MKLSISFIFFVLSFPILSETIVLSMSLEKYNREGVEITELVRKGATFYEKERGIDYLILHEDKRDLILFHFNPESSTFKSRTIMINKQRMIWSNTNNTVPLFPMTDDNWMVNWGTLTIK